MRALAERTALATDPAVVLDAAVAALGEARHDVPFALIYRYDAAARALRLARSVGLADASRVDAIVRERLGPPRFGEREPREQLLTCDPGYGLPGGVWPEPATSLYAVPYAPSGWDGCSDVIVFGLSPRLPFDDAYREHLNQIANHLELARAQINAFRIQAAADTERNNLLLQAPVGTALLTGPEHTFQLANPLYLSDGEAERPRREDHPRGIPRARGNAATGRPRSRLSHRRAVQHRRAHAPPRPTGGRHPRGLLLQVQPSSLSATPKAGCTG